MPDIPIWKVLLIAGVLGLCGLSLYPPSQRLKPGLDLAGGTTLVYQVDVPDGQDAKSVVEQVIETLKKRVDPNGVRNLVWRQQAGNRIEIQVPLPPAETGQRRSTYLQLKDELLSGNIKRREIDSALRIVDQQHRSEALKQLAGDHTQRRQLLEQLAQASDALIASEQPYRDTQQKQRELQDAMATASVDSPDQHTLLQGQLKAIQEDLFAKTRTFVDARQAFEKTQADLLATNVDPNELEHILSLSESQAPKGTVQNDPTEPANVQPGGARAAVLQAYIARHTDRADQIQAVADAKSLYDEVRGPLDDPNDLVALLRGSGVLEFRVAPEPTMPDSQTYRDQLRQRGPKTGSGKPYRWFVVDDPISFADDARGHSAMTKDPEAYFRSRGLVGQAFGTDYYILLANTANSSITRRHDDWKLVKSYPLPDDNGFRAVGFELNRVGGQLMASLTGSNRGKPMAIVLDSRVISTPTINDRIQDKGVISGGRSGFNQAEQSYLIRTLNAGSLQGRLSEDPIYIKKFGPQLGQDNLRHGMQAAVWALVIVAGFMAVYYLLFGLVADFALAANMVMILGTMAVFDATFTLPGIAGIVLTIGMAVDANVLIFERIREEVDRDADLTTSIRLGYDKALSTIIDANLTTLITCVILNYTATAEIKGFAITLMIGILATMFTALFCTRVIVDIYLKTRNPKTVYMLPTLVGVVRRLLAPRVDWAGKRPAFMVISLVLVICSLVVIGQRGQEFLDIEFRSGTQVSFELAEGKLLSLSDVRDRLTRVSDEHQIPHLAGDRATVVTVGEVTGTRASEFSIATLDTRTATVSEAIKTAFADVLDIQRSIDFTAMGQGHDAPPISSAPVYVVREPDLGTNINRPDVRDDVSDYLGGIAVVLDQMNPAVTTEELTDRIERMRLQPAYETLGHRSFTVIGLDLQSAGSGDELRRYRSAAVVVAESGTNYLDTPEAFANVDGFADSEWRLVRDALRRDTSLSGVTNFSSQISNTMKQQAIVALVLSLMAVVVYIWFRFGSLRYGLAAIVALVHDVTITLGLLALSGLVYETALGQALLLTDFKINLALVAAVLTIVGYSLNDTIVVFDRIRENRGRLPAATAAIVNDSINQTFSRTVVTSTTTLIAVLTLYIFGGDGVHGFAFAMIVGVAVGTYSSVAIAAPVLLIGSATGTDQHRDRHGRAKDVAAA